MSEPLEQDFVPSPEIIAEGLARFERTANVICAKLVECGCQGDVQQTLIAFQHRMLHGITSLRYLDRFADGKRDSALVLRGMYDLHLQILFLLTDFAQHVADYRDFTIVEQYELIELFQRSTTSLASRVRQRSDFAKAVVERRADYEAVKHRFLTSRGTRCREHWYRGTLADLADRVGLRDEYTLMQRFLSQVVHSSPIAIVRPLMIPDPAFVHDGWVLTLRVLGTISRHQGIALSPEDDALIAHARNSLF